jgi:hypothetical protein
MSVYTPYDVTPIAVSATGTTAAVTATLTGIPGRTIYLTGFSITSTATTALVAPATVTGLTNTLTYEQAVGGAGLLGNLTQTFNPGLPASSFGGNVSVTSAAAGAAGLTAVNVWGYMV